MLTQKAELSSFIHLSEFPEPALCKGFRGNFEGHSGQGGYRCKKGGLQHGGTAGRTGPDGPEHYEGIYQDAGDAGESGGVEAAKLINSQVYLQQPLLLNSCETIQHL